MTVLDFLPLLAGIGLFLFGMSILGAALEKIAGAKLEKMLERLTSSRIKGVLLGTGVTGVIQSSSATTIMVIGLLNAGIIALQNAVPIVMGANIGTTVTAQILRLGDLKDTNLLISLLNPSSFGPVLIGLGACLNLFSKHRKKRDIGLIVLGLGLIFFGMSVMEDTLMPIKDMAWFTQAMILFKNPILGILLGAVMTALLQSSSASVGILQALSATGTITFSTAFPMLLGMNVGKCITVVLASIGSKKVAKRAVFIDVMNNTLGMLVFFVVVYSIQTFIGFPFWDKVVDMGNIADFHTLFNFATALMLLPFVNVLIAVSKRFVKGKKGIQGEQDLDALDDLLLATPSLAADQCCKTVVAMAGLARDNFKEAVELFENYSESKLDEINEREMLIDRFETAIGGYIVKLTAADLTESDNRLATEMLHTIVDLERVGDRAVNIMDVAVYNHDNQVDFSGYAKEQLRVMGSAVSEILGLTLTAYEDRDLKRACKVEPLEDVIDSLQYQCREEHITRLCSGVCNMQAGISFLELLTNMERISDHCSNIAMYIIQYCRKEDFDLHHHSSRTDMKATPQFREDYFRFSEKYSMPDGSHETEEESQGHDTHPHLKGSGKNGHQRNAKDEKRSSEKVSSGKVIHDKSAKL